jgi:2-beta-glucuronyltransferase
MNKTVVLFTAHVPLSARRAGFHWIADEFYKKGWNVIFVTVDLSWSGKRSSDHRFKYINLRNNKKIIKIYDRYYSYIIYFPLSIYSRIASWLPNVADLLFKYYSVMPLPGLSFTDVDLVVFESSMGLYLGKRSLMAMKSGTRFVYRVSDDLELRSVHPSIIKVEKQLLPYFDLISTPTQSIYDKYKKYDAAALQPHGCPVHLYEKNYENPYIDTNSKNAVFVGCGSLDKKFIIMASEACPKVNFHIIGPFKKFCNNINVIFYGELSYEQCIPFVKFADIALNPLVLPSFVNSNKMQQYKQCKLPVVMSEIDQINESFIFTYDRTDYLSIQKCIHKALVFDRNKIDNKKLHTWSDLTDSLIGNLN